MCFHKASPGGCPKRIAMLAKIKFSKIAVVLFLTVLIWVWTDLALDETYDVSGASIILTESSPELWISFDGKRTIDVNNIALKGPASKITNVRRKIENLSFSLRFALDAEKEGLVESGEPLTVQSFLQKSAQFQESGLIVESTEPAAINMNIIHLVRKTLGVECFDENGALLTVESIIDPASIEILVPPDNWPPEGWPPGDKAGIMLTRADIDLAKRKPIQKKAHVRLADGQIRESSSTVEIRIPPAEERLQNFEIPATIGYSFSETMQGRFTVDLINRTEVMELITIRATNEAKARFETQDKPKMTLFIYDRDETKAQEEQGQGRVVHYNFPEEFVRRGDIGLGQAPVTVRFRLIPIRSADNP